MDDHPTCSPKFRAGRPRFLIWKPVTQFRRHCNSAEQISASALRSDRGVQIPKTTVEEIPRKPTVGRLYLDRQPERVEFRKRKAPRVCTKAPNDGNAWASAIRRDQSPESRAKAPIVGWKKFQTKSNQSVGQLDEKQQVWVLILDEKKPLQPRCTIAAPGITVAKPCTRS